MTTTVKEIADKCGVSVPAIHKFLAANDLKDKLEKDGNSFLVPDEIEAQITEHYKEKSKTVEAVEDNIKLREKIKELETANAELKENNSYLLDTNKALSKSVDSLTTQLNEANELNKEIALSNSKALERLLDTNHAKAFVEASKEAKAASEEVIEIQPKEKKKPWYQRVFG